MRSWSVKYVFENLWFRKDISKLASSFVRCKKRLKLFLRVFALAALRVNLSKDVNKLRVDFFWLVVVSRPIGKPFEDAFKKFLILGTLFGALILITTIYDQFIKAYIFRLRRSRSVLYLKTRVSWSLTLMNIKATEHIIETSCEGLSLNGLSTLWPLDY